MREDYLPFGKPNFSDKEIEAVARVMKSGWVGMGSETIAFEQDLVAYVNAPYVVSVNSCTSALFLSLLVSGVQAGDEVICPSLTWCSTANAALYLGAKPVFCDVDADTLCVTPESILSKLTPRTKAVVAVHFGGLAIDVKALRAALPDQVVIIEDAAHAIGARYPDGSPVGSSGNLTCFSFYANKNISTGEGGAIALFDLAKASRLQSLRQHALPLDAWKRFTHPKSLLLSNQLAELGYKMNYTDLQAAIGRVQLSRIGEFEKIRLALAQRYVERLESFKPAIKFQAECVHLHHARHLFTIQLPVSEMRFDRAEVLLALRAKNIGASIHYAPLHLMPLYGDNAESVSLPVTENLAKCIITLPIGASMSISDVDYVVDGLLAVIH
ncbi:MAG: DegT/DnrJ/EryC1/StrS family aminotransferase [Sulfuricella sp.]|nr:DegT/DnrJ/EryC1/StrS family aminotransferase [Sulfuricella sp.]